MKNLGYKYWIVWAVICAAFIPISKSSIPREHLRDAYENTAYLFYPETANRTLEDIDRFFETQPNIIVCRNQLATELSRPLVYIEQDEMIADQAEKSNGWNDDAEKGHGVAVERVE